MCGIAGIVHLDGSKAETGVIERMTRALAHRGPDGEGYWAEGPVRLGHRRLSIIDLTDGGSQPMHSADGRYVLTYNGEIYNFRELRDELTKLGIQFRSRSDSEVLLNALAVWGTDAIPRLNGMFAFALWDRVRKVLLVARDRYGIKPLYLSQQGNVLLFASEQKAFFAHPNFKRRPDLEGLVEYFTFQNFFTTRTLLQGVSLLAPGYWGTLDLGAAQPQLVQHQYWDFRFSDGIEHGSDADYAEELHRLFEQAVTRQLVSDVELGGYLSGGIDSGSIMAVASRSNSYLKTFTCGFDLSSASGIELGFDERAKAEAMSALFRTEHYEMVLKAGDMERIFQDLVWHMEEPRVGQSYPNYYAAKLAGRFVKVVLSGAGGDELFGGYPWRYYRAVTGGGFEGYAKSYYGFWQRLIRDVAPEEFFRPIWPDVVHVAPMDIFTDVFHGHRTSPRSREEYVNHSLYFEAKTFLHGLLVMEDKLSMAHGVETRLPFLDNDLVDFAMRCPVRLKLSKLGESIQIDENEPGDKRGRYFQRTHDGKQILRGMARQYLPQEIAEGHKQGFSGPDASWFRGESMAFVRRRLIDRDAGIFQFLDAKRVRGLVNDHLEGRENRRLLIWSLLSLESCLELGFA